MAILRGGRQIGNYDIRVGGLISRDRSLVDVEKGPRLKDNVGRSNTKVQSQINQGEVL